MTELQELPFVLENLDGIKALLVETDSKWPNYTQMVPVIGTFRIKS